MRASAAVSQRISGSFQISGNCRRCSGCRVAASGGPVIAAGPTSRFLENAWDPPALDPLSPRAGKLPHRFREGNSRPRIWLSVHIYADEAEEVQMHIGSAILVIWLIIGGFAAAQRGDYDGPVNCGTAATAAMTILAGPLNYTGVNPHINCTVPRPSN
jgi:hypothetical protein